MSEFDDLRRLASGKFGVSITSARLLEVLDALEAAEARLAAVEELATNLYRRENQPSKSYLGGLYDAARDLRQVLNAALEPHNRRESDVDYPCGADCTADCHNRSTPACVEDA